VGRSPSSLSRAGDGRPQPHPRLFIFRPGLLFAPSGPASSLVGPLRGKSLVMDRRESVVSLGNGHLPIGAGSAGAPTTCDALRGVG
jgi:hypothetical protein